MSFLYYMDIDDIYGRGQARAPTKPSTYNLEGSGYFPYQARAFVSSVFANSSQ